MENFIKIQNHGFIEPTIELGDYIFGAKQLPEEIIRPDGQYLDFLPKTEKQKKKIETYNCTNYGTHNCIEIIEIVKYKNEIDKSERYSGVMSRTTQNGNSPHKVAETIRKVSGCIPEKLLPFDDSIRTWRQYYSPKPMTENYLKVGRQWLKDYEFLHEYVFTSKVSLQLKQKLLMRALTFSPVGISVRAWKYRNGLYWKGHNERDNHWVSLIGYIKNRYWIVFDSYDSFIKRLEWNYNFGYAKRYYLKREESTPKKKMEKVDGQKLNIISEELLMESVHNRPDLVKAYLLNGQPAYSEDFVRREIGKSAERKQIIKLVNFARDYKLIDLFGMIINGKELIDIIEELKKEKH